LDKDYFGFGVVLVNYSAAVFEHVNSVEKNNGWQSILGQIKLKFLWLLVDSKKVISTKFHGNWTCTLGDIAYSLKGTESVHKRELLKIFGISCIERLSSWNYDYKWLRVSIVWFWIMKIGTQVKVKTKQREDEA